MTNMVCGPRVHGIGQRENTRMKLKRYNASGTIHRKGIGDRSTDMCVVVPSIKLDGTAASMTQRKRRKLVISSEGGGSTHSWALGAAMETGFGAGLPLRFLAVIAVVGFGAV